MHNVLVLAPHVDDESIGCGATIARFVEEGLSVRVAAFSKAVISLPDGVTEQQVTDEYFRAIGRLGCIGHIYNYPTRDFDLNRQDFLDTMVQMREAYEPDLVICPSLNDMHQDHQIIAEQACRAFWDVSVVGFESVRKCKRFDARVYIPVALEHVTRKMEAVQCYESQSIKELFPGDPNYVMSQARLRGLQIGEPLAEAFECVQMRV
jgi:LmbE family N-acetylglucosaminyl deacetylase